MRNKISPDFLAGDIVGHSPAGWPGMNWEVTLHICPRYVVDMITVKASHVIGKSVNNSRPIECDLTPFDNLRFEILRLMTDAAIDAQNAQLPFRG